VTLRTDSCELDVGIVPEGTVAVPLLARERTELSTIDDEDTMTTGVGADTELAAAAAVNVPVEAEGDTVTTMTERCADAVF